MQANNRKLQKFATTNSNFEKFGYLTHASSYNVDVYQFSAKIMLVDQSKPYTQIYLQITASCKVCKTGDSNYEKN